MTDDDLLVVLEESQRLGFLGARPIDEVIDHALGFVAGLDGVSGTIVDLGAGGGVPGFVIAHARPDLHVVLVDRRTKRTDFLMRMVRRLRVTERVRVLAVDTDALIATEGGTFDAAVARGFGPPEWTLATAISLVRSNGRVVISEPPAGNRWTAERVVELGAERLEDRPGVAVFRKS